MAELTSASINDLPDSDFAYIEPGGSKDSSGKTVPRSLRHFPIQDAAHVRNALSRAPQSPFGEKAMAKIKAAAEKFGIDAGGSRSARPDVERRFTMSSVAVMWTGGEESRDGVPDRIGGYAAKFNHYSRDLGHFVEEVEPAFFNKSRGDGWPDVICRFNHEDAQLLGTITGRTLELGCDREGLMYDVKPPASMRYIVELVQRGDVQKSSFAFRCIEDEWTLTPDGGPLRRLHTGQLIDVAPVVTPAYADTTAGLRSLADHVGADLEEVRSLAEARELRKFFVRTDKTLARPQLTHVQAMRQLLDRRADPFDE